MKRQRVLSVGLTALAAAMTVGVSDAAAAPCGLNVYRVQSNANGTGTFRAYTIRNCHSYNVSRRVDVRLGGDGSCHFIFGTASWSGGETVYGEVFVPVGGGIRGIKAC